MISERRLLEAIAQGESGEDCSWLGDPRAARAAYLVRRHAIERVGLALEHAGLSALLVKGGSLAETVYPRPWCRPMDDLDLVVSHARLFACQSALLRAGAFVEPVPRGRPWSRALLHEHRLLLPIGPINWVIEIHTHLDRITPRPVDWRGVCERASPVPSLPRSLLAPCREDHALLVILHLAVSDFDHPLAWLDLERLWRAGIDEDAFVERARAWRLRLASYLALDHLAKLGSRAIDPALRHRLEPPRWRRRAAYRLLRRRLSSELGLGWTLRQTLVRDDPARWLAGLARYGLVRAAERGLPW